MAEAPGWIGEAETDGRLVVSAGGVWTVAGAAALERAVAALAPAPAQEVRFDMSAVERVDTAGVFLLREAARRYEAAGATVAFEGIRETSRPLFDLVAGNEGREPPKAPSRNAVVAAVERLGRTTVDGVLELVALVNFIGVVTLAALRVVGRPRRFRIVSLANQIERAGLNAVPIVLLMTFLIGIVIAYQGSVQLRRLGFEILTIDMLAITVLRELGVLLTAIMIAGRSGSAFTAEIGTMKVNEEIAAMQALGLDPVEILVLPRINALVIALPILTVFADVIGLLGGAAMAIVSMDMNTTQFMVRLAEAATPAHFAVGLVKAPVFAFIIGTVGCYEGLRVSGGAESVGLMTTRSVVLSIFLVIVADAVFSIMFATMEI
jgi:phospholipid/cholesterol/gamma-HCH transport system permease protein